MQPARKAPRPCPHAKLLRIPKFALQEALKFLDAHSLIRFSLASRYCQHASADDYLWRFLAESLPYFKRVACETWK